jgi:folate-binding protein YgfZ
MTTPDAGPLLPRDAVAAAERQALAARTVALLRPGLSRFRLTGGGRVECLHGLVTCDVAGAGEGSLLFGALLSARGMIVSPLWITRTGEVLDVEVPAGAAARVAEVFTHSLPPRLCRAVNVSGAVESVGLYGPAADIVFGSALPGITPPAAPGRSAHVETPGAGAIVSRVAARGLEGLECALDAEAAPELLARFAAAGAAPASAALLEERRILAGYPRLGAEIDERTLPQEVRLDALGAVSYTKGCYLGQETVARVHFRGHTNRHLVGLALEREPSALPLEVLDGERAAGRLTSACWWEKHGTWVGLGVVRRGLEPARSVTLAGGAGAVVQDLPWDQGAAPAPAGDGP